MTDGRVIMERDESSGVARLTLDNVERKNAYDPAMRRQLGTHLEELAYDDDTKVVILRGEGGVFSTGADMNNAYAWYGDAPKDGESNGAKARRPSQRRRLLVDRQTFDFYQFFLGYPKVTVAEVAGFALGGGLELALMADIAVVADDTKLGMPATRFLGPALGSLHLFFHRLGPVLARRLLLTGDTIEAGEIAHLGVFTEVVDRRRRHRPGRLVGREGSQDARRRDRAWPRRPSVSSSSCPPTRASRSSAPSCTPTAPTSSSARASSTSSRPGPSTAPRRPSPSATPTSTSPSRNPFRNCVYLSR